MTDRTKQPCKYVLFTNLNFVSVNDIRTWTHALLLEESPGIFGPDPDRRIRGFGTDPAWPVFDIIGIPSLGYELTDAEGGPIIFSNSNPEGRPLFSGAILKLADGGPTLQLVVQDHKQPLDIKTFEGTWGDHVTLDRVWEHLLRQTPRYYTTPAMPTLSWVPSPSFRKYGR